MASPMAQQVSAALSAVHARRRGPAECTARQVPQPAAIAELASALRFAISVWSSQGGPGRHRANAARPVTVSTASSAGPLALRAGAPIGLPPLHQPTIMHDPG